MSDTLTLRARFPDGRSVTISDLPVNTTYATLLAEISTRADLPSEPERVLLAGPPPRPLEAPKDTPLSAFLQHGDSLIVEPTRAVAAGPGRRRGRQSKKTMVERAAELLGKGAAGGNASALSSSKRPPIAIPGRTASKRGRVTAAAAAPELDRDDPTDKTWSLDDMNELLDGGDSNDEAEIQPRPKRRRAPASAKRGAAVGSKRTKKVDEVIDVDAVDPFDVGALQGNLGTHIVEALINGERGGKDDEVGQKFRESLQEALKERQTEAAGERRIEAMLANRVKYTEVRRGRAFVVEYRPLEQRAWTREQDGKPIMKYPREVLTQSLKTVLGNEKDRRNLLPLEMAIRSPSVFWNMAKEFDGKIEEGLRELVPDADWSFLGARKRELSVKGKRNLENKQDMEWESD